MPEAIQALLITFGVIIGLLAFFGGLTAITLYLTRKDDMIREHFHP